MTTIRIDGMMCGHCTDRVTKALKEIGVTDIKVDLAKGTASFSQGNIDMGTIRQVIEALGFDVI